ncbi:transcription factor IIIB 50 kDa subunit [Rana temporaria]|uniref:transcription factor IIIB 50 kDa subunit n=1 Tax=Rana temporaria TaxID=8407 RepID=UPI001AAC4DE5|nr:transcription factor IIIB 50 kDa subunit [Rana temporaria]
MSRPERCPDCGSSDIVEDSHYTQQQRVCAGCGYVLTEGALTTTLTEEGFLQAVRYSESSGQNENLSKAKLRGIIRVRNLCRVLRLPDSFADSAASYYERIFPHPVCHAVAKEKKEAIMGCCVYITCRQHRWPITMGTVCALMYSQKELFSAVLPKLVEALRIDLPTFDLQNLVESHCKSFRLLQNSSNAPEGFAESLGRVLERTLKTVELAGETWLVTGRQPVPIITAAAFLSWKSLRPAPRISCSLIRFCKLCEIGTPTQAVKCRLRELLETFLQLAQQLPWLKMTSLDNKTVVQHLGDILKHRTYLLRKSMAAAETSSAERGDLTASEEPNLSSSFLPPIMKKPRKGCYDYTFTDGRPDVTGEEEISDSELEQYLRTPAEIEVIQQFQAKLDASQSRGEDPT